MAVGGEGLYEVVEGLRHLCHIGHEGGPVVLLEVDIHGVVASPRRPQVGRPQTLKVGRYTWRTGAGDEQVASELEVELFNISVLSAVISISLQQITSVTSHASFTSPTSLASLTSLTSLTR